jgi:hypothetical protein
VQGQLGVERQKHSLLEHRFSRRRPQLVAATRRTNDAEALPLRRIESVLGQLVDQPHRLVDKNGKYPERVRSARRAGANRPILTRVWVLESLHHFFSLGDVPIVARAAETSQPPGEQRH